MEKVLIIGDLSIMEKNLSDYLSGEYQVQLCTKQPDNVQAMAGILKPDLVILSHLEEENDQTILRWFHEKHIETPVLILLKEGEAQYEEGLFEEDQFSQMPFPADQASLLHACRRLLHTGDVSVDMPCKKKLLVVDDTPLMLRNLKKILEHTYDVVLATSGKQALKIIPQQKPDLVLLDYEMPEMNGREVFEAILADEDMKEIPVVFLTSVSDRKAVFSVLQSKPAGYILKPVEQEKLLRTVEEALLSCKKTQP